MRFAVKRIFRMVPWGGRIDISGRGHRLAVILLGDGSGMWNGHVVMAIMVVMVWCGLLVRVVMMRRAREAWLLVLLHRRE